MMGQGKDTGAWHDTPQKPKSREVGKLRPDKHATMTVVENVRGDRSSTESRHSQADIIRRDVTWEVRHDTGHWE